MQSSAAPAKFPAVWGYAQTSTYLQAVPTLSTGTAGVPSLQYGFNSETFQSIATGGTGPKGEYINGFNQQLSANIQWQQAGGWYTFDSAFSTAIGGYPKGALLKAATLATFWESTVENNTVNPDTGTLSAPASGWQVLQPGTYPWSQITGKPTNILTTASFTTVNAANGYREYPDGGIDQWAEVTTTGNQILTISYPIPFPTTCFRPRVSATCPSATSGAANNFVGATLVSFTSSDCRVAIGNVNVGTQTTIMLDVRGY